MTASPLGQALAHEARRQAASTGVLGLTWRAGYEARWSAATWRTALNLKLQASHAGVSATAEYQLEVDECSPEEEGDVLRWAREQGQALSLTVLMGLNPTPTPTPQ